MVARLVEAQEDRDRYPEVPLSRFVADGIETPYGPLKHLRLRRIIGRFGGTPAMHVTRTMRSMPLQVTV